MAQPYKHPTTGIYYLRRRVPDELRPTLGREFKRSLKTHNPSEAKSRFTTAWAESDAVFALARAQSGGVDLLGARDVQQLAARWVQEETTAMEASGDFSHWLVPCESWTIEQGDHRQEHSLLSSLRQALEDGDGSDGSGVVEKAIKRALSVNRIPPPPRGSAVWETLRAAFHDHLLRLSDLAYQRYRGNWLAEADTAPVEPIRLGTTTATAATSQDPQGLGLLALFDLYQQDKVLNDGDTRGVRHTIKAYRAIMGRFIELFGDIPVKKIDRAMVRDYRAFLAQLPMRGDGIRGLHAKALIEKAKAEGLPLLSAPTVRNKLRALSAVLSHGLRLGLIDENPVLASGVGRAAAKAAGKGKRGGSTKSDYSQAELQSIFTSPIFSPGGWQSPRADFGKAWYWMPLLLYYTGARREELAQLAVRDVQTSEEGVAFLSIMATPDEDDGERGVKTVGSRRFIPLHPHLLELGFMDYVASVHAGGQLFPLLKTSPDGYYGTNFGKRWSVYLRETVALTSTASPAHGFRHTFKTLCRQVGIPEDVHDAITGHAGGSVVARDYGSMPLTRMAVELARYPVAPLAALG